MHFKMLKNLRSILKKNIRFIYQDGKMLLPPPPKGNKEYKPFIAKENPFYKNVKKMTSLERYNLFTPYANYKKIDLNSNDPLLKTRNVFAASTEIYDPKSKCHIIRKLKTPNGELIVKGCFEKGEYYSGQIELNNKKILKGLMVYQDILFANNNNSLLIGYLEGIVNKAAPHSFKSCGNGIFLIDAASKTPSLHTF
ncbi:hypothetical protein [Fluviispira sanaruensis]|uniref:Uncharacterized protein n=1 Tax=Fluviispira sanaruensis TaxID=2493639 RepID=A0A4P2VQM6_FLUSA|nr:hypothetical protein [Fluviispira sanaruensis]BBH54349.1 hypothetical protein JCM31447_28130 [Fluviispira sanaruensis]